VQLSLEGSSVRLRIGWRGHECESTRPIHRLPFTPSWQLRQRIKSKFLVRERISVNMIPILAFFLFSSQAFATITGPVLSPNFPDPAVLQVGNTLYAYSTNSGGKNIPWASSTNGGSSWTISNSDALPNVGSWATTGLTWAPHVIDRGNGSYVLYYAAESPSQGTHCIGAASSTSPQGPFSPTSSPIACQKAGGGAIDASGFQDDDGTRYVVYKVDGNNLGGGGSCGNGDLSHSTPIMLQKLTSDGLSPVGNPVQILDRGQFDGPLIEAPNLLRQNGIYFLFFSSNCFNTNLYDISYATATSITGPYTKASAPFKVTGNNGLTAPGGLSVMPSNNNFAVFHDSSSLNPLTRPMFIARITYNGNIASA